MPQVSLSTHSRILVYDGYMVSVCVARMSVPSWRGKAAGVVAPALILVMSSRPAVQQAAPFWNVSKLVVMFVKALCSIGRRVLVPPVRVHVPADVAICSSALITGRRMRCGGSLSASCSCFPSGWPASCSRHSLPIRGVHLQFKSSEWQLAAAQGPSHVRAVVVWQCIWRQRVNPSFATSPMVSLCQASFRPAVTQTIALGDVGRHRHNGWPGWMLLRLS